MSPHRQSPREHVAWALCMHVNSLLAMASSGEAGGQKCVPALLGGRCHNVEGWLRALLFPQPSAIQVSVAHSHPT